MRRSTALLGITIIIVLIICGVGYISMVSGPIVATATLATTTTPILSANAEAASTTVVKFGLVQQRVSLLAPEASSSIALNYGMYVAPKLLARWQADPQSAPGRVTSSPWPDHIMVNDIRETTAGFEITGTLVLMSKEAVAQGGNDGTDPVLIDLENQNGQWLITNYEDQSQAAS